MSENYNNEKPYKDPKFVGKVLRNARKKAGLTQERLAEILNMSDKSIVGIENGKQFPLVKNFLHMIEVLNIPLGDFGINLNTEADLTKEKLIKIIYASTSIQAEKYLKAVEFVDDILE